MSTETDLKAAEEMRVLIARAKASVTDLAGKSGISRTKLSRRVNGREGFTVGEIDAVATALGANPIKIIEKALTSSRAA